MSVHCYQPNEHEQAVIASSGLKVYKTGGEFVVYHPKYKKLGRYTGNNLLTLLNTAVGDVVRLEESRPRNTAGKKKVKRKPPDKCKNLSTFKCWLLYPDASDEEVMQMLEDEGFEASPYSIPMLRNMCETVIRAEISLGLITEEDLADRREKILSET